MKTKELIKKSALELFNKQGVMNVTLRDVAADLKKSYGNITYHYRTKEVLIAELYADMITELIAISQKLAQSEDVFRSILQAPGLTYELSVKYLFLFKDYVEIMRHFEDLADEVEKNNLRRKQLLLYTLKELQRQELLQPDLMDEDLNYLMEISGAIRTFYFMQRSHDAVNQADSKTMYVNYTNHLLFPYLTPLGKKRFREILSED